MLLINSFLLLAVLEPAMWHQWINIESANSNFYYSITLLLGAWQVSAVEKRGHVCLHCHSACLDWWGWR